jgi:RIO kinase 1
MRNHQEEFYNTSFEKFHKNKIKPKGKRNLKQLIISDEEALNLDEPSKFKDGGLQDLFESGYLDDLVGIIRSGKEATVYLGKRDDDFVAVKIYADRDACLFHNKDKYAEGRKLGDKRMTKAVNNHSRIGKVVSHALWIAEEFKQLVYLHSKGIAVPKPIKQIGRAIVMELIGDHQMPAPRLSELRLSEEEKNLAFDQSVFNLGQMLNAGRAHGDYSTYNILWWNQKAFVIDFPQMVTITNNPNFYSLIQQDIQSLCKSFKKLGVSRDLQSVEEEILRIGEIKRDFLQ